MGFRRGRYWDRSCGTSGMTVLRGALLPGQELVCYADDMLVLS